LKDVLAGNTMLFHTIPNRNSGNSQQFDGFGLIPIGLTKGFDELCSLITGFWDCPGALSRQLHVIPHDLGG